MSRLGSGVDLQLTVGSACARKPSSLIARRMEWRSPFGPAVILRLIALPGAL